MTIYDGIHPLGLGTMRFNVSGPNDTQGIENGVSLVLKALASGVSYIDTHYGYSRGMAFKILREAFKATKYPYYVTLKSGPKQEKSKSDSLRRIEHSLEDMGISRAAYFFVWDIRSYAGFCDVMKPDGIYDAALKLKDEGVIKHICCSMHAPLKDMIKITESGAFEGITISYSLLNAAAMQPLLEIAKSRGIGVAAMNPLGGGLIAQNSEYFNFAQGPGDGNVIQSALRYVVANDAIQIVLSGMSNENEFMENLNALTSRNAENVETDADRVARVARTINELKGFCTGCGYCEKCPVGIPVSAIMYCRNILLFKQNSHIGNIYYEQNRELFSRLKREFSFMPETPKNPCVGCNQCQRKCTQGLEIVYAIADTYKRAFDSGFSVSYWKERFDKFLKSKKYNLVGFFPGGGYLAKVLAMYRSLHGEFPFETVIFDSNPSLWGKIHYEMPVYPPHDIEKVNPDCILISNYNYQKEIGESLMKYENDMDILCLHEDNNTPFC